MKLTKQSRRPGQLALNMASMIDIVFLVLIFFMCTTSFDAPEERLPAPLPQRGIAGSAGPTDDFEPLRVSVRGPGDKALFYVNDVFAGDYASLLQKLVALRGLADVPVIISADDGVYFKHCAKVLDLCIEAGFTKVGFAA